MFLKEDLKDFCTSFLFRYYFQEMKARHICTQNSKDLWVI